MSKGSEGLMHSMSAKLERDPNLSWEAKEAIVEGAAPEQTLRRNDRTGRRRRAEWRSHQALSGSCSPTSQPLHPQGQLISLLLMGRWAPACAWVPLHGQSPSGVRTASPITMIKPIVLTPHYRGRKTGRSDQI